MARMSCPHCGQQYRLPEGRLGQKMRCAWCGSTFVAGTDEHNTSPPLPAKPAKAAAPARPVRATKPAAEAGTLRVSCPNCQAHIKLPASAAGRRLKCPKCGKVLRAPGSSPAPAAVPPPPPAREPARQTASGVGDDDFEDLMATERAGEAIAVERPVMRAPQPIPEATETPAASERSFSLSIGPLSNPWMLALAIVVAFTVTLLIADVAPVIGLIGLCLAALFQLGLGLCVLVCAFRESVLTGILCLCLPFYVLYFIYVTCDDSRLKAMFSASLAMNVLAWALP